MDVEGTAEGLVTTRFPSIPGSLVDLTKCWSSLFNVQGCNIEILKYVLTAKFESCKAFTEVDANCWPKMFPLNPFFPPLVKDGCSRIILSAPAHTTPQLPVIPAPDASEDDRSRQSRSSRTVMVHQPGLRACLLRNQGNRAMWEKLGAYMKRIHGYWAWVLVNLWTIAH
ncbi:unnamed protein product [Arabidopsis thaliana]|uniref:Prolamin-like domain-containing protein n=1 Tax=Arabidopsis thaliana TaxID=3702 RepID=A0A654GAZ5_ARATH|nr:unnamed protein product [Arabidopsis thaliana]